MDLKTQFDLAAKEVKAKGNPKWPQETLLQFYGLFKQANEGDVQDRTQPWLTQLKARAMWDAWKAQEGKSKEQAQREYIALKNQLL